jgi:hypothetical protein
VRAISVAVVWSAATAAAVLVAEGLGIVVVGSAASRLHGEAFEVHDLDVVVEPSTANLGVVAESLRALGASAGIPPLFALAQADVVSVVTCYGRVDLMLRQGREAFSELAEKAVTIDVLGVPVLVASRQDAWALRLLYKDGGLAVR